jgi:hypothetical protein
MKVISELDYNRRRRARKAAQREAQGTALALPLEAGSVLEHETRLGSPVIIKFLEEAASCSSTTAVVRNNSRGVRWLCPDPACRANRPGYQLYYGRRVWTGKEPLRCTVCAREMVLVEAGEEYRPEIAAVEKEPTV